MIIFPAIDILGGKAVRLYKGDYSAITIYDDNPLNTALTMKEQGAEWLHVVDLEGAKSGKPCNYETVKSIVEKSGLKVELGGGIRTMSDVERYISIGVSRVILGTSAVTDKEFLRECIRRYADKIAVGVDIKDGFVAINGWTKKSVLSADEFLTELKTLGVKTVICTDISKDGAMKGTNVDLYLKIKKDYDFFVIASGGVSSIDDVKKLNEISLYGAIIGKAYYVKAIDLSEAIKITK